MKNVIVICYNIATDLNNMYSLKVKQLQNMLVTFCDHIITQKQKINSINVFPVPDQDTGSNLAVTFKKVKDAIDKKKFNSIASLIDCVQTTALYAAQGNSGIIFTGFFSGFFQEIAKSKDIDIKSFYNGFKTGAKAARKSVENPAKGTILDVIDAVAYSMQKQIKDKNITYEKLLENSFYAADTALKNTQQEMALLKESKVVDAGGLAFVMLITSFYESLSGKKLSISEENEKILELVNKASSITENRFEVVFILEDSILSIDEIKEMLAPMGDSIDCIEVLKKIKVHIHTDKPEMVKEVVFSLGEVSFLQLADMKQEKILELIDKQK